MGDEDVDLEPPGEWDGQKKNPFKRGRGRPEANEADMAGGTCEEKGAPVKSGDGLITRLNVKYDKQGWVYAISEAGAAHLAGKGDGAAFVAAKAFKQLDDPVVLHSLDLNDVHLTLIRSGELIRWKSELEILCLNELTGSGYAKDYDAVITIHSDGAESTFALEYERHPKAANRYWQLRPVPQKQSQHS